MYHGIILFVSFLLSPRFHVDALQTTRFSLCGTSSPDASFKSEHQRLTTLESHPGNLFSSPGDQSPIVIETWFHIVSSNAQSTSVSEEMIADQAYENVTIAYHLQGVTRHINETWASNGDDLGMKTALRRGTYSTLNVYFQTDLQGLPTGDAARSLHHDVSDRMFDLELNPTSILGFCSLPDPDIHIGSSRADYVNDGCNILARTMPGGSLLNYNKGGTAVHEIGHWNGLLHTFQDESCSPQDPGDYITDTPQQSVPTSGCPLRKDSCPQSPGFDAIHNFMDYSSDECYQEFTTGQGVRMRSMWASMRQARFNPDLFHGTSPSGMVMNEAGRLIPYQNRRWLPAAWLHWRREHLAAS